jgi:hypothetical protein
MLLLDTLSPVLQQVVAAVRQRTGGRVRELEVEFHDDGLILSGRAIAYYDKQLAQHAAMEASGLRIWSNRIVVERLPAR